MNLQPVIYVSANNALPMPSNIINTTYRVSYDAVLAFAKKTGGMIKLNQPYILADNHEVDLDTDINAYNNIAINQISESLKPTDNTFLVFLAGRPGDTSGRATFNGHIALLGWGNILSATRGLERNLPEDRDNYRLDYGMTVIQVMHEIAHTCGLVHPNRMYMGNTIMGYDYARFATSQPGINPMLFTKDEITQLQNHPLFSNKFWTPGPDMLAMDLITAQYIIDGKYPANLALGLGQTYKEFESMMGM